MTRGRPPHPDVLTPREWEVVALVREGLSNPEIAVRLDITERTAKFHVSEILGKLGLSSREEIAEWSAPENPNRWTRMLLPIGFGAGAAACLAVVAVLAIGAVSTEEASGVQIQPGDVIHQTMRVQNGDDTDSYMTHETWILVGPDFNTEKAHVLVYDANGHLNQEGFSDAAARRTTNTSGLGTAFDRPEFISVFMWVDEPNIEFDLLSAGMPPGVTPSPSEEPYQFVGYRDISEITVRVYEKVIPMTADPELPFEGNVVLVRRSYISDAPFGFWFGEESFYQDQSRQTFAAGEWRIEQFEVMDAGEAPATIFEFD